MRPHVKIQSDSSLVLDTYRILAALAVIIDHSSMIWSNDTNLVNNMHKLAHGAVIIFFVLSGYLISYTTTINNRGAVQYTVARLSRLYSIVFPAIIITIVIELFLKYFNPDLLYSHYRGHSIPRYFLSLFLCNEVGPVSAAPSINSPLWSLSYEFWYYAIFGILFFVTMKKRYLILLLLILAFFFTKILLLMPVWLLGFFAYKFRNNPDRSIKNAWFIILFLNLITVGLIIYLPYYPYRLGTKPLFFSSSFISDIFTGLPFALSLMYLPLRSKHISTKVSEVFRFLGDSSFPVYVLHYPMFLTFKTLLYKIHNNEVQMWLSVLFTIIIVSYLGSTFEKKRKMWASFFTFLINKIIFTFKQNKYVANN